MPQSSAKSAAPATSDNRLPSEAVRTVVSLLLFVHLFILVTGILSNEVPSQLETKIGDLLGFRQYRQALSMDLPYSYYFTRGVDAGGELDIDYALLAEIKQPDGQKVAVELPAADMWPRQRFHRYQRLAQRVAELAGEDAPEPDNLELLLGAVSGALLRSHDARSLDLRCRGQLTPPAMEEYRPNDPAGIPGTRDAYDGHAFLAGDRVELLKKESARDTAPPPKPE